MLLGEELLLLALDDERGAVYPKARMALDFALCATMLAELTAAGRLHMDERGRLTVLPGPDSGHPVLDAACAAIGAKPGHDARYWVRHLSRDVHGLHQRLLDGLVAQGTLQRRDRRILLLFHQNVFPERDGRVEHDVRARLDGVLLDGCEADMRTSTLVRLLDACGLLATLYDRRQRKAVAARIKALRDHPDPAVDAADRAIRAQTAAMTAAVIAASVAATSAACSSASASC